MSLSQYFHLFILMFYIVFFFVLQTKLIISELSQIKCFVGDKCLGVICSMSKIARFLVVHISRTSELWLT